MDKVKVYEECLNDILLMRDIKEIKESVFDVLNLFEEEDSEEDILDTDDIDFDDEDFRELNFDDEGYN